MRYQRQSAATRTSRVPPGARRHPPHLPPGKQGLYDPRLEHEACGVGFVVDVKGRKSHRILEQAIQVLRNLDHRGACGCEANTGDGAGVLIQMPHAYFQHVARKDRLFSLPGPGEYASGLVFLPRNPTRRRRLVERFEHIIQSEGQALLGWRTVPVNNSSLGETARAGEPFIRQVFIGRGPGVRDEAEFERKLYIIRKRAYSEIRTSTIDGAEYWYLCSLSHKTFVYKGMLLTEQLTKYFTDLEHPAIETALALVHSRFSTNTFPSWDRAHPYRYLAHNGEINTLRGNYNWMKAREALFHSDLFGEDTPKILPVVNPNGSDSAMLDNTVELLVLAGRSLPHAMMMLIPEPWSNHESMDPDLKAFYQYHSSLMEPWDGPASIAFTDGKRVGAVLDRNGLRPSRYYVTRDDLVIMASEAGVLEVPPEDIVRKGRLQPGRMFLVDTEQGRIIGDEEIKRTVATEHPYRVWLDEHLVHLTELPPAAELPPPDPATLRARQSAFGYTFEDERMLLAPMAKNGVEAVGSMGNDTPLAALSARPRLLYDYFKQLFAQVTNPPIDCIREELITASEVWLGSEGNLLRPRPADCRRLELKGPILTNEEFAKVRRLSLPGLKVGALSILFRATRGEKGLTKSVEELCLAARRLIEDEEVNILILSDRGISRDFAAVPALLAVSALHHYLIREGLRMRVSLALETGEAREVHHFALLIGFGCSVVNPYLAFETLEAMVHEGLVTQVDARLACKNFVKAATKGVIKVMSKMGISAIQSYHGAQVFEAVGLASDVIDQYFTWTSSRIGGIGMETVAQEVLMRHRAAFPAREINGHTLPTGGMYQWRADGEHHLFNPDSIHRLQKAVRTGSYATYKSYARLIDDQSKKLATLRGLLEFVPSEPVPLEEVEPVESILKRFKTGAMSYGSISQEAHETLAIAMNRIGGKSNTGEGGEDPERYTPLPNGDSKSSAIKQVASGRFGVTSQYLVNARELQIKMAQGAKPGEGGQLPGMKVYPWIAKTRHTTAGVGLISPPPHHDIYSIEDLAELIHDLKNANREARISVKLVSEVGVGTIAAGVAKAHADVVLIAGYDGGTGASPQTSIHHAGLPWELGIAETHQTLVLNNLRSRIAVEADGQLKTGRDVVIAA
ncbi:MAG: glutamate synthase large subunit, partial [Steroidobacteraceae bacterium]